MTILNEKSLGLARWILPDVTLDDVERVARQYDLPEGIARLLCQRGVAFADVPAFLNPTLRASFPDPFSLAGMGALADYVVQAILDKKSMAIFGDFDVDGATASAILHRFLKACGVHAPIYIPGRLTEGYGPNVQAFEALKAQGADIVFLLDCGTTAFETIHAGREMGLEILVLDHHEPEMTLPDAVHVINPKRKDDESGLEVLCAAGVVFMACVAINNRLRAGGYYTGLNRQEPSCKDFLDLVALGTVCDMVPLTGVNRLFVRLGFAQMAATPHVGLKALIEVSGLKGAVTPSHAGFVLGPRINAGSRVHQSDLGARLLVTEDAEEARNLAWTLHDCNESRKVIQKQMEAEALAQVERFGLEAKPVIVVYDENWHAGLSGLVAGRLKEQTKKPACVITAVEREDGRKELRGSGRSVAGIHIAQAFIAARQAGIIEKGGGHAMAGGFTLWPEKLDAFKAFLEETIATQSSGGLVVDMLVDGVLTVRGATPAFVTQIETQIGPFGQEHPEPQFLFRNVRVHDVGIVGGAHIRVMLSDWEGGGRIKAMAFRALGTPLGEALLKKHMVPFDVLGTLKTDDWSGSLKTEIHIRDLDFTLKGQGG